MKNLEQLKMKRREGKLLLDALNLGAIHLQENGAEEETRVEMSDLISSVERKVKMLMNDIISLEK